MRRQKRLTSAVKIERQYKNSLEIHLISYERRRIKREYCCTVDVPR